MNTPTIKTERLILRKFTNEDLDAIFLIFSDEEVNRFLPWFPLKSMEDAKTFYEEHFLNNYLTKKGYNYAVCLKTENIPVGYVNVEPEDSYELGYGLRKEFWHQGIATEACKAVLNQLKNDNVPYVTATHDVNNIPSGKLIQKLGMQYHYSYEEHWQPKDISVVFRMYQINLNGQKNRVYLKYQNNALSCFVEENI